MSFDHCAELVESADPDRFRAAMACSLSARQILFPLYAFNVEVSRAPWVTAEPMIAEMRLQWWRDVLEDIAAGKEPRKHPVVDVLAPCLTPDLAQKLDAVVAARRWDIYKDAFEDETHFQQYLEDTSGVLMWVAAKLLGAKDTEKQTIIGYGAAVGLARFMQAVPALEAQNRVPLVDGRAQAIRQLAQQALTVERPKTAARSALKEAWMTRPILKQIVKNPQRVADGSLGVSPFGKALRLMVF